MINIDNELLNVLVGSLMGRGHLQGDADNPYYEERREERFWPFLEWKRDQWKGSAWLVLGRLKTLPSRSLAAWYYMFYGSGQFRVPMTIDRFMGVGALAIWFLDRCTSSCYTSGWPYLLLKASDGQSIEKTQQTIDGFDLSPRYKPPTKSRKEWMIEFKGKNGVEAAKFLNLIAPYVPECMRHLLNNYNIAWHHKKWLQQTLTERHIIQHLLRIYREDIAGGEIQFELEIMARCGVPVEQIARLMSMSVYEVRNRLEESGISKYRTRPDWQRLYIEAIRETIFG